jgi:hypothetical protein
LRWLWSGMASCQFMTRRPVSSYMRARDSIHRKRSPFFAPERFTLVQRLTRRADIAIVFRFISDLGE